MIELHYADSCMRAWGGHLRGEIEREVGLPSSAAGCEGYNVIGWERQPPPAVSQEDLLHTLDVMAAMARDDRRLHRDMTDHYRDGSRISYPRKEQGQDLFSKLWGHLPRSAQQACMALDMP